MVAPLAGIRVLDIGGTVATGYCGKLFADHGADVVDVEPLQGAATRMLAPFSRARRRAGQQRAARILEQQQAQRGAGCAHRRRDVRVFFELARDADVVLDATVGDECCRCRISPRWRHRSCFRAITWFGQTGPYANFAGTDSVCHALIGMVRGIGPEAGPPLMPSGYQAQIVGGLTAYIGTLGPRDRGGTRQSHRGVSNSTRASIEANLCFTDVGAVSAFNTGAVAPRMGVNRFPPTFPLGIYPCRDGWIGVTALTPSQWASFCALLDLDELAARACVPDDARVASPTRRSWSRSFANESRSARQTEHVPSWPVECVYPSRSCRRWKSCSPSISTLRAAHLAPVVHPAQGDFCRAGAPFKLYRDAGARGRRGAAARGRHSREVWPKSA